jgi:hypothetical protein
MPLQPYQNICGSLFTAAAGVRLVSLCAATASGAVGKIGSKSNTADRLSCTTCRNPRLKTMRLPSGSDITSAASISGW